MQEAQAGTLDDKGLPSEAHLIGLGLLAEMDGERDRMIADHGACRVEVRLEWNPKPRRRGVVPIKVSASF